jgi:hypothetical protein
VHDEATEQDTSTRVAASPESVIVTNDDRPPSLPVALRRFVVVFLVPVAVLLAAGIAVAVRRHPTYSATTQLNVGVTEASTQGTPGYTLAAQELASSYSRQADSQQVLAPVAHTLQIPLATVESRLSVSTVPDSPTFYIHATSRSSSFAVRLADTTAATLRRQVNSYVRRNGASLLLARYTRFESRALMLADVASQLKAQATLHRNGVTAAQAHSAEVTAQVAALEASARAQSYSTAFASPDSTNLQILNAATSAQNDRKTYLERYGIAGLVAGILIGAALAYLLGWVLWRRDTRQR